MFRLFMVCAVLFASVTYASAGRGQRSTNYYNNHNYTMNSNGTMTKSRKYAH
jgi:hypothetical protein